MNSPIDIVVLGAGAAGLMAATAAARIAPEGKVVALEGARRIGAKILASGGGRCNVSNVRVTAGDYSGSSKRAIDRVLRRFSVEDTREFFRAQGVELVEEERGKLYPAASTARVIVDALVGAARGAGVELRTGHRVERIERVTGAGSEGFRLCGPGFGPVLARRLVLTTGGKSLPKSGSDGWGFEQARGLGLAVTPHLLPGLVPLLLPKGHPLLRRAGTTLPTKLTLLSKTGKHLRKVTGSMLITHVGLSGPAILDMSRHYLLALREDPEVRVQISWLPEENPGRLDEELQKFPFRELRAALSRRLPRRLVDTLLDMAGLAETLASPNGVGSLKRELRRRLVETLTAHELPLRGDQGFSRAEVTAGGVALSEMNAKTLEARSVPGLFLAGEVLDVDGRLGGFNFQWAWASGHVAGEGAARARHRSEDIAE